MVNGKPFHRERLAIFVEHDLAYSLFAFGGLNAPPPMKTVPGNVLKASLCMLERPSAPQLYLWRLVQ